MKKPTIDINVVNASGAKPQHKSQTPKPSQSSSNRNLGSFNLDDYPLLYFKKINAAKKQNQKMLKNVSQGSLINPILRESFPVMQKTPKMNKLFNNSLGYQDSMTTSSQQMSSSQGKEMLLPKFFSSANNTVQALKKEKQQISEKNLLLVSNGQKSSSSSNGSGSNSIGQQQQQNALRLNNYFQDELAMNVSATDKKKLKNFLMMSQNQQQQQTPSVGTSYGQNNPAEESSTRPPSNDKGWMNQYKKMVMENEMKLQQIQRDGLIKSIKAKTQKREDRQYESTGDEELNKLSNGMNLVAGGEQNQQQQFDEALQHAKKKKKLIESQQMKQQQQQQMLSNGTSNLLSSYITKQNREDVILNGFKMDQLKQENRLQLFQERHQQLNQKLGLQKPLTPSSQYQSQQKNQTSSGGISDAKSARSNSSHQKQQHQQQQQQQQQQLQQQQPQHDTNELEDMNNEQQQSQKKKEKQPPKIFSFTNHAKSQSTTNISKQQNSTSTAASNSQVLMMQLTPQQQQQLIQQSSLQKFISQTPTNQHQKNKLSSYQLQQEQSQQILTQNNQANQQSPKMQSAQNSVVNNPSNKKKKDSQSPTASFQISVNFVYYISSIEKAYQQPLKQDYFSQLYREHFLQTCQGILYSNLAKPQDPNDLNNKKVYLKQRNPKFQKTLIFDLDETLIHCNDNLNIHSDIILKIRFPQGEVVDAGINIRPYAIEILKELCEEFEIIVFTASHSCYAKTVLEYLDPDRVFIHHHFYREQCIMTPQGVYIKDLRVFADRRLEDIVLIDNAAYSFSFQIDNGIPVIPFYYNKEDRELKLMLNYLKSLKNVKDVREVNKQTFKLHLFNEPEGPQKVFENLFNKKCQQ